MSVSAFVDDEGVPNTPCVLDSNCIVWGQLISQKWWHNAHEKASQPLAFSNAAGRFSDPGLPFKTLYFGSDSITCFRESGLGRNLNKRFLSDRTITVDDLRARIEYTVSLTPSGLPMLTGPTRAEFAQEDRNPISSGCQSCRSLISVSNAYFPLRLHIRKWRNARLYFTPRARPTIAIYKPHSPIFKRWGFMQTSNWILRLRKQLRGTTNFLAYARP